MDYPWFQVVSGAELEQGDILESCPGLDWTAERLKLESRGVWLGCFTGTATLPSEERLCWVWNSGPWRGGPR